MASQASSPQVKRTTESPQCPAATIILVTPVPVAFYVGGIRAAWAPRHPSSQHFREGTCGVETAWPGARRRPSSTYIRTNLKGGRPWELRLTRGKTINQEQVYASGSDSHIIELSVAIDQNRQCNDLTTQIPPDLGLAQADLGAPRIGYAWRGKWWKQVAYVTDDGHLHEISFSFAVSWSQTDLTLSTGAPPAVHTNISGYVWTDGNTQYKQYAYVASDGHIHEPYAAFGGKWKTGDLTKIVKAPPADKGLISGYAWNPLGMKQVAFRSADGHIHELRCPVGGPWMHTDITASKPDIPVADLAEEPLLAMPGERRPLQTRK